MLLKFDDVEIENEKKTLFDVVKIEPYRSTPLTIFAIEKNINSKLSDSPQDNQS